MRDPMSWAIPVFRLYGVPVKVHIFFVVVTLGLFLRQVSAKDSTVWWGDVFVLTILLLFGIILLHELGHCVGAWRVGGDAKEILIWPLGGLAFVDHPRTPRATFIVYAAGPAVNVLICAAVTLPLLAAGFLPTLNPVADPYVSEMHNYRDGREYTSGYGVRVYRPDSAAQVPVEELRGKVTTAARPAQADEVGAAVAQAGFERAVAPSWVVWLNRTFWLSWVLFLFNLLPAYPLDGGGMLMAVVWGRADYRRGVVVSSYSGFVVSVLFLLASIVQNETLLMGLALFMLYSASMKLHSLEQEDGPFGYDFSAGYTSLEKDEPPPKRKKRPGAMTRWWQARKARKLQREHEQRAQDEERMDQLLGKIAATGKGSLTDDERRFLERVSARYRNRS